MARFNEFENDDAEREKESMKRAQVKLLLIGLIVAPLFGQTAQKIADVNRKVVGKWVTSDGKSYIEFLANGSCSAGELWPDGKWHVERSQLGAWQQGEEFRCGDGALALTGPNALTRDYGMGGKPQVFHRLAKAVPSRSGEKQAAQSKEPE